MNRVNFFLLFLLINILGAKAQIGYQIALLNTATGEARANETVTVSVSLSNNANEVFYSETKSATTNDFGVLSLSIGNADTFKNVDLSKMPFFIEVTANGVMIGKSQMLSVPVAEVAKQLAPIDKEKIIGTWTANNNGTALSLVIKENGQYEKVNGSYTSSGTYFIVGSNLNLIHSEKGSTSVSTYVYYDERLYGSYETYTK